VRLINLLPHREARWHRQRQAFRRGLGASTGVGLLIALLGYAALQARTAVQERRNELLASESTALDTQLQAAARLRADIAALQARQSAWAALQSERNRAVRLLEALARYTPAGVQLTALRQRGDAMTLAGTASASADVSALAEALARADTLLQPPTLVEMKAVFTSGPEPRRHVDFTLELRLQRPAEAMGEAASATARSVGRAP
jgi:type IV pilus assembly protein PilN